MDEALERRLPKPEELNAMTKESLAAAFAGESQAAEKYMVFAERAAGQGRRCSTLLGPDIASTSRWSSITAGVQILSTSDRKNSARTVLWSVRVASAGAPGSSGETELSVQPTAGAEASSAASR